MNIVNGGLYIIKDQYFVDMDDPNLKLNKSENRPFYFCLKDENDPNILWFIPLSSRVDKYKRILQRQLEKGKHFDNIVILKMSSKKEAALLIQDIFPVTAEYIERAYTYFNSPYIVKDANTIRDIEIKAKRILALIKRRGRSLPTSPDVKRLINKLIK